MLDETTPANESTAPESGGTEAAAPAKKAAARKTAAKKTATKAAAKKTATRKTAAKKTAAAPAEGSESPAEAAQPSEASPAAEAAPVKKAAAKRTRKAPAKKAAAAPADEAPSVTETPTEVAADVPAEDAEASAPVAKKATAKKTAAKKATAKKATAKKATAKKSTDKAAEAPVESAEPEAQPAEDDASGTLPLFQAPEAKAPPRRTRKRTATPVETPVEVTADEVEDELAADETVETGELSVEEAAETQADADLEQTDVEETESEDAEDEDGDGTPSRRRRRRGGRRRRKSSGQGDDAAEDAEGSAESGAESDAPESAEGETGEAESADDSEEGSSANSRRRRRRRRAGDNDAEGSDDPENTVVRVRKVRSAEDQITAVAGSTRLEAKKQRRREGREAGRRRAPIVSEAEFLARREAVERVMVIRQRKELTQIAVLEDKVLVEHYVARESQTSLIGNVYLGRVQNVLPSMEAAFVDIGKGRNAVLYAGEVNWSALGHKDGQARKIESVLSPGQPILVQVTKDPIGHKGARLTSQVSLAGRFLVYVPDGTTSGISRKLPDTERSRLKTLLKEIVPDSAGVIVRTAAEGASEDELTRDVERLKARWEDIEAKSKGNGPQLLYGEPDLTLKVVRDLFTEDFSKLVVEGDDAWETVQGYVQHVAPDLAERLEKYAPADNASAQQGDAFSVYRIDEQIAKGLDRKVWLPSGGSLVIDRTEAMTVVDVNTGKFTGSGGNLEETVTKNNLEAAEEIVRQLRLRDIGGIIVVDFIDMVLEANRDLVLRRMVECLGRDRTRHQVAEVTSLGLVQMTRKRIGTGLLETFATDCEHCHGRGLVTHQHPVEAKSGGDDERRGGRRNRGRGRDGEGKNDQPKTDQPKNEQSKNEPKAESKGDAGEDDQPRSEGRGRRGRGGDRNQKAPAPDAGAAAPSPVQVAEKVREHAEEHAAAAPVDEAPVAGTPAVSAPVEAPVEAPAEAKPTVVTRTRTRRGASRGTIQTAPVLVEAVPVVVETAVATVPESTPAPRPEVAAPKVVTRTRGRAASRPSGPPAGDGEPVGSPVVATDPTGGEASEDADPEGEGSVEHVPVKKKGARKR